MHSGPCKGKRVVIASTERIDRLAAVAERFMLSVFALRSADYAISDESELADFTDFGSGDTSAIWARIGALYGLCRDEVASERLADIFEALSDRSDWREPPG